MAGVRRVFHCSALVSDWGPEETFRLSNDLGVQNMLTAARVAEVRRFIHLSTTDVYGFPRRAGDETGLLTYRGWPYGDSKIDGENRVWQCHREYGFPVTVIRPANVYGVGSVSFVLGIARLLENRKMINLGRRKQAAGLCSVENLVNCIFLAADSDHSVGQAYNVTDGSAISWREFVELLARKLGQPQPRRTLPRSLAYSAGWLMERIRNPAKGSSRPLLTRMAVEIFTADQSFSIAKARNELGYEPTGSVQEAMDEMVAWLAEAG